MAVRRLVFPVCAIFRLCSDSAYPGPQMGYLEELVQWLDYHIKGIENNYEKKEMISIYQLYPNEAELHSNVRERKGRWIHTNQMPTFPLIHIQRNSNDFIKEEEEQNNENEMKYNLSYKCLDDELIVKKKNCPSKISFLSSEETGLASGNLLGWGNENDGGNAIDQREDDGRSITFHSLPLKQDLGNIFKQNISSSIEYSFDQKKNCLVFLELC